MKKNFISVLIIILFSVAPALSQISESTWQKWDQEMLNKANTAKNISWLSDEEKKIIQLCNLARLNGPLFAETFLTDYLIDKKASKYSRSLKKDLNKLDKLQVLEPDKVLHEIARGHAEISGKRGTTGHQRFKSRYSNLFKQGFTSYAENCAYGFEDAVKNVMELLIDEGISNLGHRKNILNPEFNAIGVSIIPHKRYQFNCVMSFGGRRN